MKKYLIICISILCFNCTNKKVSTIEQNLEEEDFIVALLAKMSLDEKIGQTNLRGTPSRVKVLPNKLKDAVEKGNVGAFLNVMNIDYVNELQRIAVEESPNGIPLIFGRDVVHGFKTIFPIPLGIAATWDEGIAKISSEIAAFEASGAGIRWTFAPMLDIARDSRWGRIAESPGEDTYLASVLGKAYVEGFQGEDLSNPTSMAASAKHFIGYGAVIGGRDYNTTSIDASLLRNVYLPPFQSALNAGCATVMTAFNEVNGVPASGNEFLLKDVLRDELNFDGFVVSDWNSTIEMIAHGFAENEKHAAKLSASAGMDMEMASETYELYLKELIDEDKFTVKQLDEFVKNILRIKYRLGLFKNPYIPIEHTGNIYDKTHLDTATDAAIKSTVLLKNENLLPINKTSKVAIIGPLANAPQDQLGTWSIDGEREFTITPVNAFKNGNAKFQFAEGLAYSRDKSKKGFNEALSITKDSDIILFFGGEEAILSGEAHSRANIDLPGAQEQLIKELKKTGKPIVLIILAGRPISITNIIDDVDAVLMAWHPGTMGGEALYEIIYGINEPGGRLPVSWPKTAGQLPFFYNHKNTGRPANNLDYVPIDKIPVDSYQTSLGNDSHYLDAGFTPHFPFGFGMTYTDFKYEHLEISKDTINFKEDLIVKVTITNIGERDGKEIAQLYIQDRVGSITRPVKELKRFKHVYLKSGDKKNVEFQISSEDLKFVNHKMIHAAEEGNFNIWVGPNAASGLKDTFYLKN